MRKRLSLWLAVIMVLLSAAGCAGRSGSQGSGGGKILLIINQIDTFRQTLVDAAKNQASQLGAQIDVVDVEGSLENQIGFIKKAVQENYDVILCIPINVDTTVELKASAGDIPIVFINSCPPEKHLEEGKYVYAGSDEKVAGQFQAEYILERFSSEKELNIAVIEGEKGHSATVGRSKGLKKTLSESGKKIQYVFDDYANWDQETARSMMEVLFKAGASVDCIVCQNDSMALGAMEACKEAGIDLNEVPILGIDATADGCAAIESGEMVFTVYQSGKGQGEAAVEAGIRMAKGESLDSMEGVSDDGLYVWVPFEKVDKSNVTNYN